MIKVTIDNSISRVEGLSLVQFNALREVLSYRLPPQQAYFGGFKGKATRYLLDKKGYFPTGLLYLVKNNLQSVNCTYSDKRFKPTYKSPLDFNGLTPYPDQIEAVQAAVRAERGIIAATTGTGKSLIAALLIKALGVRTLIVVPSLELKAQLTASFREWFDEITVGPLGCYIAIENVDALSNHAKQNSYDCVIIDEFHHGAAKTYRDLNKKAWKNVYYRFGLTATPFRSQDHERLLLESVLSNIIYEIRYQDAVTKGYIVPIEACYVTLPTQKCSANTWAGVYSQLVVNNDHRNQIIANILDNANKAGMSTLCLVKEIAHGMNIAALCKDPPAFATGEDKRTREYILEFNLKERKCLIGTVGVLGEGVDTKPAELVIIAGLGKSKNQFMQNVGRAIRKYPGKESAKIIIFKDASHKWPLEHYKEQVKILAKEYGIKPMEIEVI